MLQAYLKRINSKQSLKAAELPRASSTAGQAAQQGPADVPEKRQRLNLIWVKMGGLYPVNSGGRLRSFHILSELARHHDVTVVTTHAPGEDPGPQKDNLAACKQVISVPFVAPRKDSLAFLLALARSWFSRLPVDMYKYRRADIQRQVSDLLDKENFDFCIADFLYAVANVPSKLDIPLIYFSHNVEYMIWQRLYENETNLARKAVLALEWRKMRRYESTVCRSCDMTITVSETDRALFETRAADSCIRSIPTGVDIDYFKSAGLKENPMELVFTGSMDWHPNEDAILYFIDEVLPLIRQQLPAVGLSVVGRNPGDRLIAAARRAGVRVTGTVDDIRPYVERAAVYIVPLRIGGGTRLKIFEALSMARAVVSTSVGAEGLPLEEGIHIVRADTAGAFAESVVELLKDRQRRQRLGNAGRQLMQEKFAWPRVAQSFESLCREVVVSQPGTTARPLTRRQGSDRGLR